MQPRASYAVASLLLFGLVACTDGPSESTEGSLQGAVSPSSGDEPGPAVAADNAAERRLKRAHREPGTTEEMEIDWSDVASHARADTAPLSEEARAAVEAATLPVLLPRDAALLAGAVITGGPTWYAASLHPSGHHITINGRRVAVHQPALAADIPEDRRRQPGETSLSRAHGIVTVAFDAFGVSYSLEVECEAPTTDERCTGDEYGPSLVRGLGVAGGAP